MADGHGVSPHEEQPKFFGKVQSDDSDSNAYHTLWPKTLKRARGYERQEHVTLGCCY